MIDKDAVIKAIDQASLGDNGEVLKELIEMRESILEVLEDMILKFSLR